MHHITPLLKKNLYIPVTRYFYNELLQTLWRNNCNNFFIYCYYYYLVLNTMSL